jgi:lipoyl(octanoyl) transferase
MLTRTDLNLSMLPQADCPPVRWRVSDELVPYDVAIATMEAEVAAIADGHADELVWLLEHPPLYTAGTSAQTADLIEPDRFPVFATGRGGEYTYHGPGQRVAYVMLDLKRRRQDVRRSGAFALRKNPCPSPRPANRRLAGFVPKNRCQQNEVRPAPSED